MEDLFTQAVKEIIAREAPLAERMRPRTLEEFEGQVSLVGKGAPLRLALEADSLPSFILWGPPGTGKTTLAYIIARSTKSSFVPLNAVTSGVGEIKRVVEEAQKRRAYYHQKTILFIDDRRDPPL